MLRLLPTLLLTPLRLLLTLTPLLQTLPLTLLNLLLVLMLTKRCKTTLMPYRLLW